jgi:hypothetical protein
MSKIEHAIRALRDVDEVSLQAEGDEIREIHVLTSSSRSPKQIVRDIQTLLHTKFQRGIDHRVVSVAFTTEPHNGHAEPPIGTPQMATRPTPGPNVEAPPEIGREPEHRIRFSSANLFVSGPRIQAQVELSWKGLPRMGSATGHGSRDSGHRLVAQATLGALQEFLEDDVALALEGMQFVPVGHRNIAVVAVELIAHRDHKSLVGCCTVEQDVPQAVALATLAAVNRMLGGLPTREPTEYVLRPTSV